MKKTKKVIQASISIVALLAVASVVQPHAANAATTATSTMSQSISAGVISTSIRDSSGNVVASPSFSLNAATQSTSAQTATGTFGSNTQRITVDNPGGANNGWTLALAATGGASATWTSGANTYAYNGTAATGQLTVDPSVATLTVATGTTTGITKGTATPYVNGTTAAVTLLTASSSATTTWNGYLTGVNLSQAIPASQAIGTYTLGMTQTVTAS